jgi:hypothetical protein
MLNKFAIILGLAVLINPSVLLARGLLIPEDKKIAPLILIKQIVDFKIEDQRRRFFSPKPFLELVSPCKMNEGISRFLPEEMAEFSTDRKSVV